MQIEVMGMIAMPGEININADVPLLCTCS